jgi:hypothetical protein
MDFVTEHILPHWPAVGAYFAFILIGEFVKRQIFTKKAADGSKVMHWFRRTLAMHAPIAGIGVGALPGIPVSPGVEGPVAAMFYFFVVGCLSSFTYHAVTHFVKHKWGVDIAKAIDKAVDPDRKSEADADKTPKP